MFRFYFCYRKMHFVAQIIYSNYGSIINFIAKKKSRFRHKRLFNLFSWYVPMFILDQQCEQMIRPLVASVGKNIVTLFLCKKKQHFVKHNNFAIQKKMFFKRENAFFKKSEMIRFVKIVVLRAANFSKKVKRAEIFSSCKRTKLQPFR